MIVMIKRCCSHRCQ